MKKIYGIVLVFLCELVHAQIKQENPSEKLNVNTDTLKREMAFIANKDTILFIRNSAAQNFTYQSQGLSIDYDVNKGVNVIKPNGVGLIERVESTTAVVSESTEEKTNEKHDRRLSLAMRVYNDATGFNPDQPNGIVQSEASLNIRLKGWRWWKEDTTKNVTAMFFNNIVFPTINLFQIKDDSSYRYAPVHYLKSNNLVNDSFVNVHTLNLVRYSNFNVSAKVNLFTLQTRDKGLSLFIDAYGAFYRTGLSYDSLLSAHLGVKKEDSRFMVNSAGAGLNIKFRCSPPKSKLSLEASTTIFGIALLSNDVKQNYGRLYYPDYNKRNDERGNIKYINGAESFFNGLAFYSFQIRYSDNLENSKNKTGSGFFFRVNFFSNPWIGILNDSKRVSYGNNYLQIQTGISKNLDDVLKFLGLQKAK
ncbi:MAG: hypothetical protein IT236_05985 [Bacteroidia bacterium]|nr:hypothetical protein [Bacteroidia bacterium]